MQLILIIIAMLRLLLSSKVNISLPMTAYYSSFSKPVVREHYPKEAKKPYEILLSNSVSLDPKIPIPSVFKNLKSRSIARIMSINNTLTHQKVIEGHIQCLYALVQRGELSIEAINCFVSYVSGMMHEVPKKKGQSDHLKKTLQIMMTPLLLYKFTRICVFIDPFYNENMRSIMCSFIVLVIRTSRKNGKQFYLAKQNLKEMKQSILKGIMPSEPIESTRGLSFVLDKNNVDSYCESKLREAEKKYQTLNSTDLLAGMYHILELGYYSTDTLQHILYWMTKQKQPENEILLNTILRLRILVTLQKFLSNETVAENKDALFRVIYPRILNKYIQQLLDQQTFQDALHSEQMPVQTQLVTEFLTQEEHNRVKNVYLQVANRMLDTFLNGSLLIQIKRLTGIFEVLLIMCSHSDTPAIHKILAQFEKCMVLYPTIKLEKVEGHYYLAQRHGFKSDVFAEIFFNFLLSAKNKIDKNKQLIHRTDISTREVKLADKFLTYLSIASKPPRQSVETAQNLASSLFMANVWWCLPAQNVSLNMFFGNPAFGYNAYFQQSKIQNTNTGDRERQDVNLIRQHTGIKQISKNFNQVLSQAANDKFKESVRLDHHVAWRQNHHARLLTLVKLSNHHASLIARRKNKAEVNEFLNQLFSRMVGNAHLYTVIKNNLAYPLFFGQLLQLSSRLESNSYPIISRDLAAVKRMFNQQVMRTSTDNIGFRIEYQEKLQALQLNRVHFPFIHDLFTLSGVPACVRQSLHHEMACGFRQEKERLKMEIETFYKFNRGELLAVTLNYCEYPYLADLKISKGDEEIAVVFKYGETLNMKLWQMRNQSDEYWRSKGFTVYTMRSAKDVQKFLQTKIKNKAKSQH